MKIFALPALAILALSACQPTPSYQKLTGDTMGTSYHITAKLPANTDMEAVRQAIDTRLNDINKSMSTYDDSA
ncbi:MAG: FAD:protein FMN transferase, partial [Moraxella sp.]|nr:FAD:protein FMN transferase [Moraxella sp.]